MSFFLARCGCWECSNCERFRTAKLRRAIECGDPDMFLTLTAPPAFPGEPEECARMMSGAFNKLVKRIKRLLGVDSWPFFLVVEATSAGAPHFHVCARSAYIHQRWLSAAWKDLTGAPIVHVRRIQNRAGAARYLANYLKQAPHQFASMKRYRSSRDYQLREPEKPAPFPKIKSRRELVGITYAEYADLMLHQGWRPFQDESGLTLWRHPLGGTRPPLWENPCPAAASPAARKSTGKTGPPMPVSLTSERAS